MESHVDVIGDSRYFSTAEILDRLVLASSSVVEIGANDASFRNRYPDATWSTVDKFGSPDVVADLDSPGCELPYDSGSIDVVICTEVLEHLVRGSRLVAEMGRIIGTSGTVVISVPNIVSLKSRCKVAFGRLPNMAASGDCGHDLGGFGVLTDNGWVGGHVVDFNESRLKGYLKRGNLIVTKFHSVPITVAHPFSKTSRRMKIPSWLYPRSFSDFILCEAQGISVQNDAGSPDV